MRTDIDSLDCGPDWLTVTTENAASSRYLRGVSEKYMGLNHERRPWHFLAYVGRTWHDPAGTGGVAFGERLAGDSAIMQVWGELSNTIGQVLHLEHGRVTRCDLQVTVLHSQPTESIRDMLGTLDGTSHKYLALIPVGPEGGTLYIGARGSDMFARMYDKGVQLGGGIPARTLWRYEVEYKRKCAADAALGVWAVGISSADRRDFILRNVEHYFREHGVPTPFVAGSENHHSVVRYGTRQQDAQKTLLWLSQQVQPAILRLAYGGHAEAVAEALGLTVKDGVPYWDAVEVVPTQQLDFWPQA